MIANYDYNRKQPLIKDVNEMIIKSPSLKERKKTADRIISKIKHFTEVFLDGLE